jgi:DNA-binding beta-propeller fold protein YncE
MKKRIILNLTFLFMVIANGQFFESYIALPENSPGVNYLRNITYNRTNNKLYLYGDYGDLAILDATTLNLIKMLCFRRDGDAPPCWLPENNKFYVPAIVDTPYFEGFFVLDGETDSITDTVRTGILVLPDDIVDITYNQINQRIYFDDFDKCRIRVTDAHTHNIVDSMMTIGQPYLMEWNPTNNRLYASCTNRNSQYEPWYSCLNIFDAATNQILDSTRIRGGDLPYDPYPYGGLLYNPFLNKLYFGARTELIVIDCSSDSVIKRLGGYFPHRFLFNRRNNKIYNATDSSLQLSVIDCVTDSVIKVFPDRRVPSRWTNGHWCVMPMSYDSLNNKIFVFTFSQDSVERLTVIDGETDSIIEEYPFTTRGLWCDD